jgi:plastocyanin
MLDGLGVDILGEGGTDGAGFAMGICTVHEGMKGTVVVG